MTTHWQAKERLYAQLAGSRMPVRRRLILVLSQAASESVSRDQRTYSRHNTFHSNGAYNDIVNNFIFFTTFDGRLAIIELVILQEEMGE